MKGAPITPEANTSPLAGAGARGGAITTNMQQQQQQRASLSATMSTSSMIPSSSSISGHSYQNDDIMDQSYYLSRNSNDDLPIRGSESQTLSHYGGTNDGPSELGAVHRPTRDLWYIHSSSTIWVAKHFKMIINRV
jgi:hypothetical protein